MRTSMVKPFIIFIMIIMFFLDTAVLFALSDYLKAGSARCYGMGEAFSAVSHDSAGILFNPAILSSLETMDLNFMMGKYLTGLDDGTLGSYSFQSALPLMPYGNIGLGFILFSASNNEDEDLYQERVYYFSYSYPVMTRLLAGLNIKYLEWRTGWFTGYEGYSEQIRTGNLNCDIGLLYQFPSQVRFSLVVYNPVPSRLDSGKGISQDHYEVLQPDFRLGSSWHLGSFLLAADMEYKNVVDAIDYFFGMERPFFNQVLFLRAGCHLVDLSESVAFSLGFGVMFSKVKKAFSLQADYSLEYPLGSVRNTWGNHLISIKMCL